jgi:hypothetical protein
MISTAESAVKGGPDPDSLARWLDLERHGHATDPDLPPYLPDDDPPRPAAEVRRQGRPRRRHEEHPQLQRDAADTVAGQADHRPVA